MSRLIDADALMQAMYNRAFETDGDTMWQSGCWVRYRAIEQVVKEQPTVEERKTGEWIYIRDEENGNGLYECPICHRGDIHAPEAKVNFCWNCGAKMEGGKDE